MLGDGIGDSPRIDGWVEYEYLQFLELPMFNGGKNGKNGSPLEQRGRIGTSYLAYDCSSNIVCVAAHLDASFLKANPSVQVEKDDGESWIRFGEDNGSPKLKESNADEFMYVGKPNNSSFIIGYEGCWSVDILQFEILTHKTLMREGRLLREGRTRGSSWVEGGGVQK